jgi:tellurite resistance protein TerC
MVETTDLLFAVDSVPAVFAVTRKPFIVFTSNVFAILGLRSLYFLLAGALGYFRYLKYGLPLVLIFMGVEMLIDPHDRVPPLWFQVDIPTSVSLLVVAGILFISIVLSITAAQRDERRGKGNPRADENPKAEGKKATDEDNPKGTP